MKRFLAFLNIVLASILVLCLSLNFNVSAGSQDTISSKVVVKLEQQETTDLNKIRYIAAIKGASRSELSNYVAHITVYDNSGNIAKKGHQTFTSFYDRVLNAYETSEENVYYAVFTFGKLNTFSVPNATFDTYFDINFSDGSSLTTNHKTYKLGTKYDFKISNYMKTTNGADLYVSSIRNESLSGASVYYRATDSTTYTKATATISNGKISVTNVSLDKFYVKVIKNNLVSEEVLVDGSKSLNTDMVSYIRQLIDNTTSYIGAWTLKGESAKKRWNYIDGVFLNAVVNMYNQTGDEYYKNFFLNFVNYYIDSNGNFINKGDSSKSGYNSGELDSVCESKILFDAYKMATTDSDRNRYLTAIKATYTDLTTNVGLTYNNVNYSHKSSYANQVWLDGLYMYIPFLARYANFIDEGIITDCSKTSTEIYQDIRKAYAYVNEHMYDESTGLYHHAHDTAVVYDKTGKMFWADKTTGNSKSYWLRAEGWLIASLVDVIEYIPSDATCKGNDGVSFTNRTMNPQETNIRKYLISMLDEAMTGLMQYQDPTSKMFRQVINEVEYPALTNFSTYTGSLSYKNGATNLGGQNYLETSGTSIIAYVAMKGARCGYLNHSYSQKGIEIFEGIQNSGLFAYENSSYILKNICVTAGLTAKSTETHKDGSVEYYLAEGVNSDEGKGIAPFALAGLEYGLLTNYIGNDGVKYVQNFGENTTPTEPTVNSYTVTFETNGDNEIADQIITENNLVAKPTNPTKNGYTFQYWTLDGVEYDFNTPVTTSITLVATWKKNETPTTPTTTGTIYDMSGKTETLGTTSKTGGLYYSVSRSSGTTSDEKTVNATLSNGTLTLTDESSTDTLYTYYRFGSAINSGKLKVTATINGPSSGSWSMLQVLDGDKNFAVRSTNTTTKYFGYTFAGGDSTATTVEFKSSTDYAIVILIDFDNNTTTLTINGTEVVINQAISQATGIQFMTATKARNLTVKSLVIETIASSSTPTVNSYTATFETNSDDEIAEQIIVENDLVVKPTDPTRAGYVFQYWTVDGEEYDFNTPVTSSITLVASWKTLYTVTFNSDGGSTVESQTIIEGNKATKPEDPTKNGYTFQYWTLNNTQYSFDTAVNSNITLVASWKANSTTPATSYVHDFTASEKVSDFFTISGNLSDTKGTITYNGLSLTKCLKMEESTSITFTTTTSMTLTLVFSTASKKVKIDGTACTTDSNSIVTASLSAGKHTITKGDAIFLYYMSLS